MKLLTCVVPCYNSAAYMERAVDSLLSGGEEMEILIVNDGSKDATGEIADRLAKEHPGVVFAHHQENGGHGSAINYGIQNGTGLFFKVLDSDDRVIKENMPGLMDLLRRLAGSDEVPDMIMHDYVYDNPDRENVFTVSYWGRMKPDTAVTWEETRPFHIWNQFIIHCLIYRTQFLRDIALKLPEHIFYDDNIYIYRPLAYTKRILYHPHTLYGYYVGRSDQSVNDKVILSRLNQVTSIAKQMITSYKMEELNKLPKHLRKHMINNCCGQLFTTSSLQFIQNDETSRAMNKDLWDTIRNFDPELYRALRRNPLGRMTCLPGRLGQLILIGMYRFGQKLMHFKAK